MADSTRKRAQELVDGATNQGRGIDGRPYWNLVDLVQELIDKGDSATTTEVKPLTQYLPDAVARLEGRIDALKATVDRLEPTAREVALVNQELRRKLEENEQSRVAQVRTINAQAERIRALEVKVRNHDEEAAAQFWQHLENASPEALLEELRRRITEEKS